LRAVQRSLEKEYAANVETSTDKPTVPTTMISDLRR
jgi:hypothetical protein